MYAAGKGDWKNAGGERNRGMEEEFEQEKRSSFARGVLVEAEYCFTNAVGRFTKEALRRGATREILLEM